MPHVNIPDQDLNTGNSYYSESICITFLQSDRRMLKAPPLKPSGLHFSVFQDRSKRGAFNKMFEKVLNKKKDQQWYMPDIVFSPHLLKIKQSQLTNIYKIGQTNKERQTSRQAYRQTKSYCIMLLLISFTTCCFALMDAFVCVFFSLSVCSLSVYSFVCLCFYLLVLYFQFTFRIWKYTFFLLSKNIFNFQYQI